MMETTVQDRPVVDSKLLVEALENNFGVLQRQVNGLTHEDSLLQLPFRGNCLNWVIGHLVERRDRMLELLDKPPLLTAEQTIRYQRNSEPITSGDDALPFEKLLADLATAQEQLLGLLSAMSSDDLMVVGKQIVVGPPPQSIGEWLHFLIWHETYHTGQTEILRQLTGINDKVI
jgi:hypothetical protein